MGIKNYVRQVRPVQEAHVNHLEKVQSFLRDSILQGYLSSAHDISDGGLSVALSECCISSGLGANCQLPISLVRLDRLLFGEGGARVIVSVSADKESKWKDVLNKIETSPS